MSEFVPPESAPEPKFVCHLCPYETPDKVILCLHLRDVHKGGMVKTVAAAMRPKEGEESEDLIVVQSGHFEDVSASSSGGKVEIARTVVLVSKSGDSSENNCSFIRLDNSHLVNSRAKDMLDPIKIDADSKPDSQGGSAVCNLVQSEDFVTSFNRDLVDPIKIEADLEPEVMIKEEELL